MASQTISATQKRQTLSHKKKGNKVTIKNILATPYSNYWPLVSEEDASLLKATLSEHLVCLKAPKINVPYTEIAGLAKEQRTKIRNEYAQARATIQPCRESSALNTIKFGINNSARLLEQQQASSVLITSEVNPQFMVKHIADLAVSRRVPVLVVPQLKSLLLEKTGIASTVVTFKIGVKESKYAAIDQEILQMSSKYPVPLNHISLPKDKIEIPSKQKLGFVEDVVDEKGGSFNKDLYLYRGSGSERVFKPELSKVHTRFDLEDHEDLYISFSAKKSPKVTKQTGPVKTVKVSYKSLLVKRVVNNPNRGKQKIEALKRKRE